VYGAILTSDAKNAGRVWLMQQLKLGSGISTLNIRYKIDKQRTERIRHEYWKQERFAEARGNPGKM
jgi:hypothetical protein